MPPRVARAPSAALPFAEHAAALAPHAARLREAAAGDVEVLCAIPSFRNARTIGHVVRAVEAGLRKHFPDRACAIVVADGGSHDGTLEAAAEASSAPDEAALLIHPKAPLPARVHVRYPGPAGKGNALRAIFELARQSGARACATFDADLRSVAPHWVEALCAPVLDHGADHVAPLYARHKHDGTITNSVAYPLTAALYGRRVRQPIGGDFGFSGALAARWAREEGVWDGAVGRFGIDIFMTTTALAEGYGVAQARLGAKIHDPKDPAASLGPMFREVVGTLFTLAARYRERWGAVGAIEPVPTFGFPAAASAEPVSVDRDALLHRFADGVAHHRATLERVLRRAPLAPPAPGPWAGIVLDFLAEWLREPDERLLDALLPLYFGRTAAFVEEAAADDAEQAEARIERFADEFFGRKGRLGEDWALPASKP